MQFRNGIVLNGTNNKFERIDLRVANGKIFQLGVFPVENGDFDCEGNYVIPGFIDTHIHGSVGVEFASPDEDFSKARKYLAENGVTGFAATVRALPIDRSVAAEKNILREMKREGNGSRVLGINLEGPFVSKAKSGVMNPPDIECNVASAEELIKAGDGNLKIMTLAPERENAEEVIKKCVENGVNISIGHTDSSFEEADKAIKAGASRATHIFNAMKPLTHRDCGVLGAVLTDENVCCEMICDLVHLDAPTMKLVLKLKGYENVTLVSDTGFMSGLSDGEFVVDGRKRFVKDGVCRNADGRIAGSCVPMTYGARNLLKLGVPLDEVSVMGSLNPAKALGIESEYGSLREGRYADLIVCDKELNIKAVFVGGERVI